MTIHVELLDPFGAVVADGNLDVADVPGIDEHTPSVLEEIRMRLVGQRINLAPTQAYRWPPYSIRVEEVTCQL